MIRTAAGMITQSDEAVATQNCRIAQQQTRIEQLEARERHHGRLLAQLTARVGALEANHTPVSGETK